MHKYAYIDKVYSQVGHDLKSLVPALEVGKFLQLCPIKRTAAIFQPENI